MGQPVEQRWHTPAREVGDEVRLLLAERRDVALRLARITPAIADEPVRQSNRQQLDA